MRDNYIERALHLDYDAFISTSMIKAYMLIKPTIIFKEDSKNLESKLILDLTNHIKNYLYVNPLLEIDYLFLFETVQKIFKDHVVGKEDTLTLGQSQLWINSFFCLLYSLNYEFEGNSNSKHLEELDFSNVNLDIPLDDGVFRYLGKEILDEDLSSVSNTWIDIIDYQTYSFFQKRIRSVVNQDNLMNWYMNLLLK